VRVILGLSALPYLRKRSAVTRAASGGFLVAFGVDAGPHVLACDIQMNEG
jgi:hypothetical protein